jgi:ribose transport system substrate-binding protein
VAAGNDGAMALGANAPRRGTLEVKNGRKTEMKHRFGLLAAATTAAAFLEASVAHAAPYKVYLSMSYIGNDWQAEAANMVKAMVAYMGPEKLSLEVQVSGPNAQRQIQQINAMVQAGANAIVVYPISPTALNQAIKNACDKGVVVVAYDSIVTEPCAYNTTIDQDAAGRKPAEWLVNALHGKGNIVVITGVPGTSVDTARTAAAKDVFAKNPGIHILAEANGMWSQSVARSELSKIIATHPWKDIDGIWVQAGCYTVASMEDEAGIADKDKKPCAGEGSNGHRIQMLKSAEGVEGASGTYRPMGYPSISYASPPYSGALALKHAIQILDGKKDLPKLSTLPLPLYTSDEIKLCKEGTWAEMKAGCNVFQPQIIANPGWFASIYSAETPEVGLNAALVGTPEPKQ